MCYEFEDWEEDLERPQPVQVTEAVPTLASDPIREVLAQDEEAAEAVPV